MQNPVSLLIDMLSPRGRIARRFFLPLGLGYFAVWWSVFAVTRSFNIGIMASYGPIGDAWMDLFFSYAVFCLYSKRLHDLSWSAIPAAILLIPWPVAYVLKIIAAYVALPPIVSPLILLFATVMFSLNPLFFLLMAAWPGKKTENQHGRNPRTLKQDWGQIEAF